MIGYAGAIYKELDPKKKDAKWADEVTSLFRMYWRPLVSPVRGVNNRQVMYGLNNLDSIKKTFKDKKFKESNPFTPLPIMDVFVNAVVEELVKHPPVFSVKATDPTSVNLKRDDLVLLKNRKILEQDVSSYQTAIGLPPYKVPYEKFNGNVEQFDKMQLNENDPEDMNMYEDVFQKIWIEIGAQAALNNIFKVNEFDETTLRRLVKDIFAINTISVQAYVDQITGEIKHKYVDPDGCYGIFGDTNDGINDICRGWYKGKTLGEWLAYVGDCFDFERDWKNALWGINFYNGTNYTGFIRGGINYNCQIDPAFTQQMTEGLGKSFANQNLVSWDNAYMFKVWAGYMEWQTPEATSSYVSDGINTEVIDYDYEITPAQQEKGYQKTTKYQNQWYRTYFLGTSSVTQYIYGFQKLYFQHLEGANDEYSNGTLCWYQEQGKAAVELAETYLYLANFTYQHMLWLIFHTKPDREDYVIDELITLAKVLQKQYPELAGNNNTPSFENIFKQALEYQHETHIRLRTYPEVEGRKIPQLPPDGKRPGSGGLDPTAVAFQAVTQWAIAQISQAIGINPMRLGANPPARESLQSEQNTLNASFTATGYIYRMCQYLKKHLSKVTLNYCSDIVNYPDTIPYKWLLNLIGDESFGYLKLMNKTCAHRMGIFFVDQDTTNRRQDLMTAANLALSQKLITFDQWWMVTNYEDPKQGAAMLARAQRLAAKRIFSEQMQAIQAQGQNAQAVENIVSAREKDNNQAKVAVARIQQESSAYVADTGKAAKVEVKNLQNANEQPKEEARTQGAKEVLAAEADLKQQEAIGGIE